jgi:hypothetical protein
MELDDLDRMLKQADRAEVISGLLELTGSDRRKLGPKVRGWVTQGTTTPAEEISDPCMALALFGTAGSARQAIFAATHFFGHTDYVEDFVTILQARDPDWLPDFVEAIVRYEGIWVWRHVRGLVRAGAVPAPEHPEYFRGTVRAAPIYYSTLDRTRWPVCSRGTRT